MTNDKVENYYGSRWVKVDFHIHTPGSKTFKLPSGINTESHADIDDLIQKYIDQIVSQNIKVIAITDYNGIRKEWFNLIRQKGAEHDLVIFPGVELSFNVGKKGLHILSIFPIDSDVDAINERIIALAEKPPVVDKNGEHIDIKPKLNIESELMRFRKDLNALIIIPHPNEDKGLFTAYTSNQAAEFLKNVSPTAIEDYSPKNIEKLISTGNISEEECKRFASVEFSDPKQIKEIGNKTRSGGKLRTTFLKLSEFEDLEAIRMALNEPDLRVQTHELLENQYTFIRSINVEGNGFCSGLTLQFSPELNVIIGSRGVGKSAILELIRYSIDLKPYNETDYRTDLIKFALGSGGKINVYIQQVVSSDISRLYRFERVFNERPHVYELKDNEESEVDLEPRSILNLKQLPFLFGQREIYELTRNEDQRLRLLDDIVGKEAEEKLSELEDISKKLGENSRKLLDIDVKLGNQDFLEQRIKEIEHQIKLYKDEGLTEKLEDEKLFAQDKVYLSSIEDSFSNLEDYWEQFDEFISEESESMINQTSKSTSKNKKLFTNFGKEIKTLHSNLSELMNTGLEDISVTRVKFEQFKKNWEKEKSKLDKKLIEIRQELNISSLSPDELNKLIIEQTEINGKLENLQKKVKEKESLEIARKSLAKQFRDIRYSIFELRSKRAKKLTERLSNRVNISIEYKTQKDKFKEQLLDILKGSKVNAPSIEKLSSKDSVDGQQLAIIVRNGFKEICKEFKVTEAQAKLVETWFTNEPDKLFDLELLGPEDKVEVFLNVDNFDFIPLEKLSDGQKATAMLLIFLTLLEHPLIIDQPEDDLDNRFIYDDIVRLLCEQKAKRQVIVATHNPNIPVLGDAELIVSLEVQENRTEICAQGSIDNYDIRESIKRIMEGGEEAFRRRAEKYGWLIN